MPFAELPIDTSFGVNKASSSLYLSLFLQFFPLAFLKLGILHRLNDTHIYSKSCQSKGYHGNGA
jgi:hypothetical protein